MAYDNRARLKLVTLLVIYVLYRIVWLVLSYVNRYRAAKYRQSEDDYVEEHVIICKYKFDEFVSAHESDLLGWFTGYVRPEALLGADTHWSLYTINEKKAYFVHTKRPFRCW